MARKAATRALYSLTHSLTAVDSLTHPPAHAPTRPPAHPLTGSRRPRLKLDELEPRIAPSSLLYHLPTSGPWGQSSAHGFNAVDSVLQEPHSETALARFTPVLPSELGDSLTPQRRREAPDASVSVVAPEPESFNPEPDAVLALLADLTDAGIEAGPIYPFAFVPAQWEAAADLTSDSDWLTGSPAHAHTSIASTTSLSLQDSITPPVPADADEGIPAYVLTAPAQPAEASRVSFQAVSAAQSNALMSELHEEASAAPEPTESAEAGSTESVDHEPPAESAAAAAQLTTSTTSGVWGPWITAATWNQGAPYNQYVPVDPSTGRRSPVGCVATAAAQVVNYWRYPGSIDFSYADDHYTSRGKNGDVRIDEDASTRDFPTLSSMDSRLSTIAYDDTNVEKAELSFGLGIKYEMGYSSSGSGAFTSRGEDVFLEDLGFGSAKWGSGWGADVQSAVIDNLKDGWPVILSISGPSGGHSVVLEGYRDSDGMFYVNLGWGGSGDGWYSLPNIGQFNHVNGAVYDIAPYQGWSQWGSDSRNSSFTPYVAPMSSNISDKWFVSVPDDYSFSGMVVGSGGKIYAAASPTGWDASDRASLLVIDGFGVRQKSIELAEESQGIAYPVQSTSGEVFVFSDLGRVYRIDPRTDSATRIFTDPAGGQFFDPTKIDGDGYIYASTMEKLYSLDRTGAVRWSFDPPGSGWIDRGTVAIDEGRNRVYIPYYNPDTDVAYLACLDRQTGTLIAEKSWSGITFASYGTGTPSIGNDGTVYVGTYTTLYALNPDSALSKKWELPLYPSLISQAPAIGRDGTLYISYWKPDLINYAIGAVDPSNGTVRRELLLPLGLSDNAVSMNVMSNGVLVFDINYSHSPRPDTHKVFAYRDTGTTFQKLWEKDFGESGGRIAFGPDETIYVMPTSGYGHKLTAFSEGSRGDPHGVGMAWTDNSAPNTPTNTGVADGSVVSGTSVTLSWNASDPESNALTYELRLMSDNAERVAATGIAGTSYTVDGLMPGAHYFWKVLASDGQAVAESPSWTFSTSDTLGPRVTNLTPSPGSTVASAATIVVTFDEDVLDASVSTTTLKVSSNHGTDGQWGTTDDTYVQGTVAYDAATDTATFTPSVALTPGEYAVWLDGTASITDLAGNRLDGEFTGAFPSGNGTAGGDFLATFTISAPTNPERVSVASEGTQSSTGGVLHSFSADGRFVAFGSDAANLVPGDTNARSDVFVYDRQTHTTERVSLASDGSQGNDHTYESAISGDGRFVAFQSFATNLVPGDANGHRDIFLYDRALDTVTRINLAPGGAEANEISQQPAINADGRYVAFSSRASNLVAGDTNNLWDIFVYDRQADSLERVSVVSGGAQSTGGSGSYQPSLSPDGRFVTFYSEATNLVTGDTNDASDIFVHDRQTHITERVSVASDGTQGHAGAWSASAISADGRFVAFESASGNLVPGDSNTSTDIFVYDRQTDTVQRVDVASDGTEANSGAYWAGMTPDARYVAFYSHSTNLVPGDTNLKGDIFVRDRLTQRTERVSLASDNSQSNADSYFPFLSADGRYVAFHSEASNLVPGDTNNTRDAFVYDRGLGDTAGPRVTALTPTPDSTVPSAASVTVTFDEDLTATTVNATTVKVSRAQGPDGQWGTGDDTYVTGTVTYSAANDQATFTPSAALGNGEYAVWLDGAASITDLDGNTLDGEFTGAFPSGDGTPGGDFLATFTVQQEGETEELSRTHRRWVFQDQDGDTVTVSFGGSAGTATLTRGVPEGQQGDIETITFEGTDARTSLTVTVRESKDGTPGDGTSVQTISGDGLGTLNMKNVDLIGNTIELDGALKRLVVDDILDGSDILLGGEETDQLTITADQVGAVNLFFPGILKTATVSQWTGGMIEVNEVGTLTVKNGALGAGIQAQVVGRVSVTGGDLTGDIQAAERIASVSVKNGTLAANIVAGNASGGSTRLAALGSVKVEGGNITGSITVENGGNAGSILAKAVRGVGGAIGDDADDAIMVAGRLTSVTSNGPLRASVTVQNESGSAKGNALSLVKAIGGSLFGAVEVLNDGNLGTLQARRIEANVNVEGKATLVRTELDRVVADEPAPPFVTVTAGGKATVRGANKTKVDLPTGGTAYVVAV